MSSPPRRAKKPSTKHVSRSFLMSPPGKARRGNQKRPGMSRNIISSGYCSAKAVKTVQLDVNTPSPPLTKERKTTKPRTIPLAATGCFNDLNQDLIEYIVDYLEDDIPTLGALACVSKSLQTTTYKNARWEGHLKLLFQTLFSDNTRKPLEFPDYASDKKLVQVEPLGIDPFKFIAWYDQQAQRVAQVARRFSAPVYREVVPVVHALEHSNRLLLPSSKDAWLRGACLKDYYRYAGAFGIWAEVACQCYCLEHSTCYVCFGSLRYGPEAKGTYCPRPECGLETWSNFSSHMSKKILKDLPKIRLFRELSPRWAQTIHQDCLDAQQLRTKEGYAQWVRTAFDRFG